IMRLGTNGVHTNIITFDCYNDSPALSPDGRIAFHNHNPDNGQDRAGLYVSGADGQSPQRILTLAGAGVPASASWSRDGRPLSFGQANALTVNLSTINADGSTLSQITGFGNLSNGFPSGALWAPADDSLVGAGTIFGTNGLWLLPLNASRTACVGSPIRLPT